MAYLAWDRKTTSDFSDASLSSLYHQGYLFGRTGKGDMYQTRSLRIDLSKFELSSENRRVLRKTEEVKLKAVALPYANYNWTIGKMGKDFYDTKFGDKTFSANKIKELMTDEKKSNFNTLLVYSTVIPAKAGIQSVGYAICYQNSELFHYCYPFYRLSPLPFPLSPNTGLGMMLKAIVWAKKQGKKYIYLGSFNRPTDTYKLQFAGIEWRDGKEWKTDLEELKKLL